MLSHNVCILNVHLIHILILLSIFTTASNPPVMDQQMSERVFHDAFGGYISDIPQPDADAMHKALELTSKIVEKFDQKADPDGKQLFRQTFDDFAWQRVPLSATQEAFTHVFEMLDDHELRDGYADFLDAPLDNAEQEAAAKVILLRITGLPATMTERPHAEEIRNLSQVIVEDAESRWKDQPEKLGLFLTGFVRLGFEEDKEAAFEKLIGSVSFEVELVGRLEKLRELMRPLDGEL
ncbi:hypothetical protein B0J13DRAFT_558555, partial [Dactylonectria estremocensis]